jgi:putative nucleotidyltransferase with HDIG domain
MAKLSIDDVMAKVTALPALPQIVNRILESLNDENANIDSLSDIVAGDPAVSVRLLAAANSGIFGGHKVASLRQAMMLLGIGRVRQITVATAIIDRYSAPPPFDSRRMWRHSLAVAICAQDLARFAGADPETAYMAGLLHDIGQLLLFVTDSVGYVEVLRATASGERDIVSCERELFGIDHAVVGRELARRWNLPETIATAIGGHHEIGADSPETELADVVHVAEGLSHALDLGAVEENRVPAVCDLACARLGVDWGEFADHFPAIEARFDGALLTLGL